MSYLRHVVHVSVPRPLLHCHRKHFRGNGLGGGGRTPKAAALARSSDRHRRSLHRPTALCLRHRRRRQRRPRRTERTAQRLFYSHSSIPLFLLSPLRGRPIARCHCRRRCALCMRQPATVSRLNQPVVLVRRARTGPACRLLSCACGGLLAAVTFLPGLSRRGRSRPKLAKGGGSLCLTLWIHIEPEERHRTIPIKPMCFLS